MNLLEELKNLGVNVDEGIERLMGNASLYERMLFKFLEMMIKTFPLFHPETLSLYRTFN